MGLKLTVDTKGLNPKFIEQLERKMRRDWQNHVKTAAQYTEQTAKSLAPVRTGALRKSITTELVPDGFFIGSRLRYSGWQEFGTRLIRPVAYLRRAVASMLLKFRTFRQA